MLPGHGAWEVRQQESGSATRTDCATVSGGTALARRVVQASRDTRLLSTCGRAGACVFLRRNGGKR